MNTKWIFNNFGLKLFAFVLAAITWFYVANEMNRAVEEERQALFGIFPYRMMSKKMDIKPNIVGAPVEGYKLLDDGVKVEPGQIIIIGPKSIVEDLLFLKTETIDLGEYTKSLTKEVSIDSVGNVEIPKEPVKVFIPIEKIEPPPQEEE
jgi:hypothetical protein